MAQNILIPFFFECLGGPKDFDVFAGLLDVFVVFLLFSNYRKSYVFIEKSRKSMIFHGACCQNLGTSNFGGIKPPEAECRTHT